MTIHRSIASASALALLLCACNGNGATPALPAAPSVMAPNAAPRTAAAANAPAARASVPPAQYGRAWFRITIPAMRKGATDPRHPFYVSPNTGSLRIALTAVDGQASNGQTRVVNLTSGSANCSPASKMPRTCSVAMRVPAAEYDTFALSTYASPAGTGKALAIASVTDGIEAGKTTLVPFTLGGVVASIALSPATIHPVQNGKTASFLVSLTPLDASGAVIVGKAPFASPISIAVNDDPQHALLISEGVVTAPGIPFVVRYNGAKTLYDGKVVASAGAVGSATADVIPLAYMPSRLTMAMGGKPQTIAVSEVGFRGKFTATIDDPRIATPSVQSNGPGKATVTVTPAALGGSSGPATVTIGDGTRSGTVGVVVTAPVLKGIKYYPQSSQAFSPFFATVVGGNIYMTASTNILEFNPSTRKLTSYPVTTSGFGLSTGIAADRSGNLWFAFNTFPAEICEMALPTHAVNCYSQGLQSAANVYGVALGPDGNIWFADPTFDNTPAIGKIDVTSHVITEYSTGLKSGSSPYDVAGGTDGKVYFSDVSSTNPAFGSIDPTTGAIAEYTRGLTKFNPKTERQSLPYHIAIGPDGDVWGADGGTSAIDHFSVTQHRTQALRNGIQRYGNPSELVFTSTGQLWFLDVAFFGQLLVGKVDTATGAIQEYSGFPTGPGGANFESQALVTTSPKDLWFASGYAGNGAAMAHIPI